VFPFNGNKKGEVAMRILQLTFLTTLSLVLVPGPGGLDVEAREKVPLFEVLVGDKPGDDLHVDSRGQSFGGINKGPREKQVAELSKKRRGLRDQLDKALRKNDQKKTKKVAAKLQSVEQQLSQLARIERGSSQAIGNAPDDPTWFWKRKCKGCGTRHGKPHCPTFGTNPGQKGGVLAPIGCNCDGRGCGYCDRDPDQAEAVRKGPGTPPTLLTRPLQGRSELAPVSGGEFDGKKRKRCLTCGKKHKINGGKCLSVGNDDVPNSRAVRPSRGSGLFPRSGRGVLSRRGVNQSVPVRQPGAIGRPVPVRRPKPITRLVPVRRPKTRVSQKVKPVRKPR
tara:strand:- start:198 stop:1205 length:1008 start_codon:yes stop_codon:yes gene_type:complete